MKSQETVKVNLFLSTGTLITIYYAGSYDDIGDNLSEELESSISMKCPFLVPNWNVEQMVIKDGNDKLLFTGNMKDEPSLIDTGKLIGWSIE